MSGVSNIRQVVSNTPAVERIQETQNRSQQTGQEQFARQLEEEAERKTRSVQDRAEIERPEEDDEQERDEKDGKKKGKKRSPGDTPDEDEAGVEEESPDAVTGSETTDPEANPGEKDDDDDTDEERHVDVVA